MLGVERGQARLPGAHSEQEILRVIKNCPLEGGFSVLFGKQFVFKQEYQRIL